jgi:DisA bacterial checkpoint controller nucleotide-binding
LFRTTRCQSANTENDHRSCDRDRPGRTGGKKGRRTFCCRRLQEDIAELPVSHPRSARASSRSGKAHCKSGLTETIKELAQLDGAFIVSDSGVVLSACRYINASSDHINLPMGLGSRHMAAASITQQTNAVAVVVSESSIVRVFDDGELIAEILPELWLLRNFSLHLAQPYTQHTDHGISIFANRTS